MLQTLFNQALPGLETLFAALISLAVAAATRWINAHAKNTVVNGIMSRLLATVEAVVNELEQTVVSNIQKDGAPLTPAQRADLLNSALDKVRTHLGPKGIAELEAIFQPDQLNAILISYIESEVHRTNASQQSVAVIESIAPGSTKPSPGPVGTVVQ